MALDILEYPFKLLVATLRAKRLLLGLSRMLSTGDPPAEQGVWDFPYKRQLMALPGQWY